MLTLYHLALSHYSEKARWALDHKELDWRSKTLTPGFHILTVRRVGGGTTVPVLVDDEAGRVVNDSTDILHYLDGLRPEPALFPEDPAARARVAELEDFFDEHCARHISGFFYHYLLDHPRVLTERWSAGLGPMGRFLVRASMPVFPRAMRRLRGIDAESARQHRTHALEALDHAGRALDESGGQYLAGDRFTAADLTAVSVLGPAVGLPGSPWDPAGPGTVNSPGYPPDELVEFVELVAAHPLSEWVRETWATHRPRR